MIGFFPPSSNVIVLMTPLAAACAWTFSAVAGLPVNESRRISG